MAVQTQTRGLDTPSTIPLLRSRGLRFVPKYSPGLDPSILKFLPGSTLEIFLRTSTGMWVLLESCELVEAR